MATTTSPKTNSSGYVYVDAEKVVSNLFTFKILTKKACKQYLEQQCPELQAYMRANAPWQDRPNEVSGAATWESNARDKLTADYEEEGGLLKDGPKRMIIKLSHGVSYGIYLEYNGTQTPSYLPRRRPILEPTKEEKFPEVFNGLNNLLDRFSGIFGILKVK